MGVVPVHFLGKRHPILKEAPFQHHFANIISTVGVLHCVSREDQFFVDLETKHEGGAKSKFLDITCSFANAGVRCAVELKFKTAQQAAQDHGRIDAYSDIAALEDACRTGYDFGRFYMITDSTAYVHRSVRGTTGMTFCLHHGHTIHPPCRLVSTSKGREGIVVDLRSSYEFHWTHFEGWYFLELRTSKAG